MDARRATSCNITKTLDGLYCAKLYTGKDIMVDFYGYNDLLDETDYPTLKKRIKQIAGFKLPPLKKLKFEKCEGLAYYCLIEIKQKRMTRKRLKGLLYDAIGMIIDETSADAKWLLDVMGITADDLRYIGYDCLLDNEKDEFDMLDKRL